MGNSLVVLMYHEVTEKPSSDRYAIPLGQFERHLEYLARTERTCNGISHIKDNGFKNSVCITFDDGYLSDTELVVPKLKEYGFRATFFISTGLVGSDKHMQTWEGIGELLGEGMDVQAHGHSHSFLDTESPDNLKIELERPIEILHEKYKHKVEHLSLPGGRYNQQVLAAARQAGYKSVSTSIPGYNKENSDSRPLLIKRNVIHQLTSQDKFESIVDRNAYQFMRERFKYETKKTVKKVLGNNNYQTIWNRVMK